MNKHKQATTRVRRGCWLQRFVRCHGRIIQKSRDVLGRLVEMVTDMVGLDNLDYEQSAYSPLGNSNHFLSFALATPNPSRRRTPRKRIPAWSCGDTLATSRLGYNHPENGGDASKPHSTASQQSEPSVAPEKT